MAKNKKAGPPVMLDKKWMIPDLMHGYPGGPIPGDDAGLNDLLHYLGKYGFGVALRQPFASGSGHEMPVEFQFSRNGNNIGDVRDARIKTMPSVLLAELQNLTDVTFIPYPGVDLRWNTEASPIGALWTDHPHASTGQRYYRHKETKAGSVFAAGSTWSEIRGTGFAPDRRVGPGELGRVAEFVLELVVVPPSKYVLAWRRLR